MARRTTTRTAGSRTTKRAAASAARKRAETVEETGSLEDRIRTLASTGKLKHAARAAIKQQLAANLPIVYLAGDRVVREHPDGTIETLRVLENASRRVPERYRSLVARKTASRPK
jgi:hypothetical protein